MTFKKAFEELKALAGDRPCLLSYELASYFDGIQIRCYIQGVAPHGHAPAANTYRGAIDNMKDMIAKHKAPTDDPAPEDADIPELTPITRKCVTVGEVDA
jgi:hypothetical protein